jgi:DNA recombination protein RmuC
VDIAVVAVIAGGVGVVVGIAFVRGRASSPRPSDLQILGDELRRLSDRVSQDTTSLSNRLEGIDNRMLQTQTTNAELARDIFGTLGEVRQATETVAEQAREFGSLQDLLKPPKARGGVGEAMLEELLRQVLPPHSYAMQHRFRSGVIVDAVVRAGGRLVPIDSKFPLSNYRRMCDAPDDHERRVAERAFAQDVSDHIRAIAERYIVPDENTLDFAVMYVPAEGVYGEVLRLVHRKRPLFEAAIEARVMPMSPLTMYGYLQTVLYGLRCLRIEERAEQILAFCGRLEQDMERFSTEYETLGRHIINARSKYEDGAHKLDRLRAGLERATDVGEQDELADEERPTLEAVHLRRV